MYFIKVGAANMLPLTNQSSRKVVVQQRNAPTVWRHLMFELN